MLQGQRVCLPMGSEPHWCVRELGSSLDLESASAGWLSDIRKTSVSCEKRDCIISQLLLILGLHEFPFVELFYFGHMERKVAI